MAKVVDKVIISNKVNIDNIDAAKIRAVMEIAQVEN